MVSGRSSRNIPPRFQHMAHTYLSQLNSTCSNVDSFCFLFLKRGLMWPSLTFNSRSSSLSLQCWLTGICHHTQLEGLLNHSIFYPSATPVFINATPRKLSCTSKKEWPLSFWKRVKWPESACARRACTPFSACSVHSLTLSCSCGNRLPA